MIPTEANEPLVTIIAKYLGRTIQTGDPLNDWLSHVLDPTARDTLFALTTVVAALIGR
jgi:hypothetical protein